MTQPTAGSGGPCPSTSIPVQSLRYVPSADHKYIVLYAQTQSKEWVPLNVGLTAPPSLQQVRDVDCNISLNTGSYTDAHFYLRSADGNNVTTAYYTDAKGGAIQSGNTTGFIPLNLQPLGGTLTYGGAEVATIPWVQAHTPNLEQVATSGNAFNGDLVLGSAGNELFVGSGPVNSGIENTRLGKNTLAAMVSGNWNTAIGSNALCSIKYGLNNVSVGEYSMPDFVGLPGSYSNNTAVGDSAGLGMTQGLDNTMIGAGSGYCGGSLRSRGDNNTFLGAGSGNASTIAPGTTALGSNNIFIGNGAGGGPVDSLLSNQLRIGNINNFTTDKHTIEGTMTQGAQTLTFNASVTMPSLAGGGNRMVYVDNAGKFQATVMPSASSNYWVNTGSNVSAAISPAWITPDYNSGFMGVHTGGGLGTGYLECTGGGTFNIGDTEHLVFCDSHNPSIILPDPSLHDGREIKFIVDSKNLGTPSGGGLVYFNGSFVPQIHSILRTNTAYTSYAFPLQSYRGQGVTALYNQNFGTPPPDSTLTIKSVYYSPLGQYFWMVTAQGFVG